MSTNARRLEPDVPTARFDWQGGAPRSGRSAVITPVFAPILESHATTVSSALRDLPSPAAERQAAAEQDAYARGLAAGHQAAREALAAEIDEWTARLAATIDDIGSLRSGMLHRAERDTVRLAIAIAEQIARREIARDPGLLLMLARQACDRLGDVAAATIRLNPEDHALITGRLDTAGQTGLTIEADPAIPRGGCAIRSAFGTVDAGIDAQVRELSRMLLDEAADPDEVANHDDRGR